jgi:cell division protein FtsN
MAHDTHHNLEQAEHSQHAAHNAFDRSVAMTMAIIAAVLAFVTMMSHRSHTETLRLQSASNVMHTKASDQWNYYQAKNIRFHEYTAFGELQAILAKDRAQDARREQTAARWREQAAKYERELTQLEAEARRMVKEAEELQQASAGVHHRADRFDLGELGVELALVLSSLAVLTKRRSFWLSGIGIGTLGAAVAATGFLLH